MQPFAELARGGATIVYKAHQESLDRTVLLKVLRPEFSRDEMMADRFEEEARMIARIQHPNVVTIHDFGRTDEGSYFVTEFVEGIDLHQLLERDGRLPLDAALGIALQAACGLRAAHRRGIVHGDFKPANLLLSAEGRVKLTDFGLASTVARKVGEAPVSGTPGYIAPELIRGHGRDAKSDLFGLGAVLYECVTGRAAFPGETTGDRLDAALNRDPLERVEMAASVPEDVRSVLADLLAKDPDDRISDAAEAERRLEQVGRLIGRADPEHLADYLADPEGYESQVGTARERSTENGSPEPGDAPVEAVPGSTGVGPLVDGRQPRLLLDPLAARLPHPLREAYEGVRAYYLELERSRRHVIAGMGFGLVLLLAGVFGWWLAVGGSSGAGGSTGSSGGGLGGSGLTGGSEFRVGPYSNAFVTLADTGWVGQAVRARVGSTTTVGGGPPGQPLQPPRTERVESPPRAYVEVSATPDIDSVRVGELLLTSDSLTGPVAIEPGTYMARLYHAPYPVIHDSVEAVAGETRTIRADFMARVGWVTVSANPWGTIYVNGEKRDTIPPPNPNTYMLPIGTHEIVVRNDSLGRSERVTFTLAPRDTVEHLFDFLNAP